jgi:hypothetical protein
MGLTERRAERVCVGGSVLPYLAAPGPATAGGYGRAHLAFCGVSIKVLTPCRLRSDDYGGMAERLPCPKGADAGGGAKLAKHGSDSVPCRGRIYGERILMTTAPQYLV